MSTSTDRERFNKQLAYSNGVRRVKLLARRCEQMTDENLGEALKLGTEAVAQGRRLLALNSDKSKNKNKYYLALGKALRHLGTCFMRKREHPQAIELLSESVEQYKAADDLREMLSSLFSLTNANLVSGNIGRALELIELNEESLRFAGKKLRTQNLLGMFLTQKTLILEAAGRVEESVAALKESILNSQNSNHQEKAYAYLSAGNVYYRLGRFDEAIEYLSQGIAIQQTVERDYNLVVARYNYAIALRARSRYSEAIDVLELCMRAAYDGRFDRNIIQIQQTLAESYTSLGRLDRALANYAEALNNARRYKADDLSAALLAKLGRLYAVTLHSEVANKYLSEAIDCLSKITYPPTKSGVLVDLIEYAPELCDKTVMEAHIKHILEGTPAPRPQTEIRTRLAYGMLQEMQDRSDAAEKEYSRALEMINTSDETGTHLRILIHLGLLKLKTKEFGSAMSFLTEAIDIAESNESWELKLISLRAMLKACEQTGEIKTAVKHFQRLRHVEITVRMRAVDPNAEYRLKNSKLDGLQANIDQLQKDADTSQEELQQNLNKQHIAKAQNELYKRTFQHIHKIFSVSLADQSAVDESSIQNVNGLITRSLDGGSVQLESSSSSLQDQRFAETLRQQFPKLTGSEQRVCQLVRKGHDSSEVCDIMHVSLRAVETYRYRIRRKMALDTNVDLRTFLQGL